MRKTIQEEAYRFIVDTFLFGEVTDDFSPNTSLLAAGIIDSTGVLELVAFLENRFQIRFDDREIIPENLDSVENIGAFVSGKMELVSDVA